MPNGIVSSGVEGAEEKDAKEKREGHGVVV